MTGEVIVTGARAPVAQDLARAFAASGRTVHLVDSAPAYAARMLRPRIAVYRVPPPRQDFAGFRQAMRELLAQTGAARIVPTCEEVFWLAEAARRDGYPDKVFAPSVDILRMLHSKADFAAFAGSLGLDVPDTRVLASPNDVRALAGSCDELVLKPEFSRFGTHALIGARPADLHRVQPSPSIRWVAQQRVRGEEVCAWAAVRDGVVCAFAAYRPRWRQGNGAAYLIESIASPALRHASEAVAAATGMTGHLSFDAMIDGQGRTLLIECNPRAVSGLHLFDASPAMANAVLEGGPCVEAPVAVLRHMGPAMTLLGLPAAAAQGRLRAFLDDWKASREIIARGGGAVVHLGCMADAARFAAQALRSARSPAGMTTADIEWDGEPFP